MCIIRKSLQLCFIALYFTVDEIFYMGTAMTPLSSPNKDHNPSRIRETTKTFNAFTFQLNYLDKIVCLAPDSIAIKLNICVDH